MSTYWPSGLAYLNERDSYTADDGSIVWMTSSHAVVYGLVFC